MTRREFVTALLGTAAAAALPLHALTPIHEPTWLREASALTVGDMFTIDGVYARHAVTGHVTGHLQYFLLSSELPVSIHPRIIADGPYANCSALPSNDAHLGLLWTGDVVPCTTTWVDA